MAFLDEYVAVMNRTPRVKVRNGFKWGRTGLIDNAFSESACRGWRTAITVSMKRNAAR